MYKSCTTKADNTLAELWAVKDETAARFRSAAEYLAHLCLRVSKRASQARKRAGRQVGER